MRPQQGDAPHYSTLGIVAEMLPMAHSSADLEDRQCTIVTSGTRPPAVVSMARCPDPVV